MGLLGDHREDLRARGVSALWVLGVALAYYAASQIGMFTTSLGRPISSLWLPVGVALACLLMLGPWVWPGIAVGTLVSSVSVVPLPAAVLIAVGNTLAPVCAYLLLRRVGFRIQLDRLKDALALVFLAAFAAMSVSATVGAAAVTTFGMRSPAEFLQAWAVWWSSDCVGVLVVTPFLLVLRHPRKMGRGSWTRRLELAILLVVTFAVSAVGTVNVGLLFVAFPLVIWAAWRFQLPGVAPCTLIISAIAIGAAAQGHGIFAGRPLLANIVILQIFNGSVVLSGLLLAVVITEWRKTRASMDKSVAVLSEAVGHLQRSMQPAPRYMPGLVSPSRTEEGRGQNPEDGKG